MFLCGRISFGSGALVKPYDPGGNRQKPKKFILPVGILWIFESMFVDKKTAIFMPTWFFCISKNENYFPVCFFLICNSQQGFVEGIIVVRKGKSA